MASERDRFIKHTEDVYSRVESDNVAWAVVFTVRMLGPVLLDIRDCLASIADRMPPR